MSKFSNKFFCCVIGIILVAGMVFAFASRCDMNVYENRYAQKLTSPTVETVMNSEFQDNVEIAVADQLPLSGKVKKLYNVVNGLYVTKVIEPIVRDNPDVYIKYKSINFFGANRLVYDTVYLDDVKEKLDFKSDNLNNIFAQNSNLDFYVCFIEKDTDINFETNEKSGMSKYILKKLNLPEENKINYEINSIDEFKDYFYATDHHWNHKGSYKAYSQIIRTIAPDEELLVPVNEKLVSRNYSGSKSNSLCYNAIKEDFFAYEFVFPEMQVITNGSAADDYGNQEAFFNNQRQDISYGKFYGGDDGEIIFSTNNNKENIVVIGESFDNAILKLLASHFNNTHSIDLRYYEHYMGEKFDIEQYAKENNIDKVLLIGNVNYFKSNDFILE